MPTQQLLVIAAIVILANALLILAVVVQARLGRGPRGRGRTEEVSEETLARRLGRTVADGAVPVDVPADGSRPVLLGLKAPRGGPEVAWDEELRREHARATRYRRPATVVLVEVLGLERLARQLGQDVADRVVVAVGSTLRAEARVADQVAALSPTRFGTLLPETDEIQAINFVERVRQDCDRWLESGIGQLRVAIGWAQIGPSQAADRALAVAEERLLAERRSYREQGSRDERPDGQLEGSLAV